MTPGREWTMRPHLPEEVLRNRWKSDALRERYETLANQQYERTEAAIAQNLETARVGIAEGHTERYLAMRQECDARFEAFCAAGDELFKAWKEAVSPEYYAAFVAWNRWSFDEVFGLFDWYAKQQEGA